MVPSDARAPAPSQTLEQRRARQAWEHVIDDATKKVGRDYRGLVRKAPAMIKTNGLGQFLAFLLAKAEQDAGKLEGPNAKPLGAEALLYRHTALWLCSKDSPVPWGSVKGTLMERVLSADSWVYRQAAAEALLYLGWLKRFAEAQYGGEGEGR